MAANASVRQKKAVKRKYKSPETVKVRQTAATVGMLKNALKSFQVAIGVYSFFNILFWLAYTAKLAGKDGIYIIFKPAWDLVGMFYTYRQVANKDNIDYTGLVCSICIFVIVIILNSMYEYMAELEEQAKIADARRLEKAKKRALAEQKNIIQKKQNAKNRDIGFIFLMDIEIKQVSGFIQSDPVSPEEIAKIKSQFFKALLNNLNLNQVYQKGYYKKKLFLNYNNISYFDDFIFYTKETLNSLSKEFTRTTLRIDFLVSLNLIHHNDDIKEKLDILDLVNKLGLKNEFICTQKLKDIYEASPKRTFQMISKGVYNLSKNLNISNNQEIYSLREV